MPFDGSLLCWVVSDLPRSRSLCSHALRGEIKNDCEGSGVKQSLSTVLLDSLLFKSKAPKLPLREESQSFIHETVPIQLNWLGSSV